VRNIFFHPENSNRICNPKKHLALYTTKYAAGDWILIVHAATEPVAGFNCCIRTKDNSEEGVGTLMHFRLCLHVSNILMKTRQVENEGCRAEGTTCRGIPLPCQALYQLPACER